MKIQLITKALSEVKTECLVLPVFEEAKGYYKEKVINDFLTDHPKFGKLYETQLLYYPAGKILLVGLGKKNKLNFANLQNWAGTATKYLLTKTSDISLLLPETSSLDPERLVEAAVIGIEVAVYDSAKAYKSDKQQAKLINIQLVVEKADRGYSEGVKKGQIISESINLVRTLGDMPANKMTPNYFLNTAKKIAKENKLKITVLNEKQAQKKGMGAFVGVAQGSDEPSFMIAIEYKGNVKTREKWGIVGKGITFDSGGISIKPSDSMHEMKYDMCGAATVLAVLQSLSKLKVKANVVGVMAVTENLPGGKAQRPGDIVESYSGKTVEILNTDAEGRLVLLDALSYAQKDFKATKLIDLATLTGAIIIALGNFITGIFGNNPKFTQDVIMAGARSGERIWELPMDEEFDDMIKSEFADIANLGHGGSMGTKTAGSITGAKFIEAAVVAGKSWVHLDIAGTAWDMKARPYRQVGATGVGVQTLVELIKD